MFGYNLAVNNYNGTATFYLCWGTGGNFGLNGDGTTNSYTTPVEIDMSAHADINNFLLVEGGAYGMCGIHATGKLYCWGNGDHAQLTDNSHGGGNIALTPVVADTTAEGITNDFIGVSNMRLSTCAIHNGGGGNDEIYCWGHKHMGQLGNGTGIGYPQFQLVTP